MSAAVLCGACEQVVYPDALTVADHRFGYTWWGCRARWTHETFGLVHVCEPSRRALVWARDGVPVANPPWKRWLWRCDWTRPLARKVFGPGRFTPPVIIRRPITEQR